MNYKIIENDLIPIYESDTKEKLVNARELYVKLGSKQEFANWIKNRIKKYKFIENIDFFKYDNFVKVGNLSRPQKDYYLSIDTAKEIAMIENNELGRQIRRYFIEVEKRYCLAADIAEQLHIYSENELPHMNLIGAIARQLGYKISYKHYYEDEYIAIVPDMSKGNEFWQVYYKPNAVEKIIKWFDKNKENISYTVVYQKNTKNGMKGEVKEKGFKIENICYKVKIIK